MKMKKNHHNRTTTRGLILALALAGLSTRVATAHPYATCLTNNAGTVSFRLNEAADTVRIIWNGGANSFTLGAVAPGLTVTNVGAVTSPFKVEVFKVGSGTPSYILPTAATTNNTQFYGPRAISINKRPASPYFGRIYVGNSPGTTAGGRATGDGIYMLNNDMSDAIGQGNTALTAGLNMVAASASMPWRIRVGQDDDNLYICDFTDVTGNLFQADPNVSATSGTNVFMAPIGAMASPLDPSMNHGSLSEVYVTGSQATGDLTVYTTDEDYETTPGFQAELNCLWKYVIGANPFPWSTYPDQKVGNASIVFNASQTMGLDRATNGYFYLTDGRSAGGQFGLNVIDPAGPTVLWDSLTTSQGLGSPNDLLSNVVSVAVSSDMKYCAVQRSTGLVILMRMTAGIPDLAGRIEFSTVGTARQIGFDAADNIYVISAVTERMRIYSLGLTTTATTTSDPTGSGGAGGAFTLETPSTEVSVTSDTTDVFEAGATTGTFTITRANFPSIAVPLAVSISMGGTATRTNDYVLKTNNVVVNGNILTIPAGTNAINVTLTAVDDTTSELTETAILNINASPNYSAGSPPSAQMNIIDNDKPMIDISLVQGSMYERIATDYTRFRLTRRGDLQAATFGVNIAAGGGTAAPSRYTLPANPVVNFNPGDVSLTVDVNPVNDNLLQGDQTFVVTVAPATGGEYVVGTNAPTSATATIVDDEVPAETTILYSQDFNVDDTANWKITAGSANGIDDYRANVFYDYSSGSSIPAIPAAPHSTADTIGFYMTANKDEGSALGAAGVNAYPIGKSFSGNYAVRFDMFLMVGNAASTTEYALFGINHDSNHTNWFRNSTTTFNGVSATPSTFDGLFYGVEADGAALGDYVIYSAPTTAANNPTALTPGVSATTLTGIFKNPPFGGNITPGAPGSTENSTTPTWADVEVSKVGRLVRLKIDNTLIMSYTNTTAFTNGDLMLGYTDAYDSIMTGASGVVYDNLRVVRLDLNITNIKQVGANTEISFNWGIDEATTFFKLQSASVVTGPYTDEAPTMTKLSPGSYKATVATGASPKFYRLRIGN